MYCSEACHLGSDRPGFGSLGLAECNHKPLLAHTTHAVPSPANGIHFLDFAELDDHIHMLSWAESDPKSIVSDEIYEIGGVTLGPQMPTQLRPIPEAASVQAATIEPLTFTHYSVQTPFILILDVKEVQTPYIDASQTPDV